MSKRCIRLAAIVVLAASFLLLYSRPLPKTVTESAISGQAAYRFHNYDYLYDYEYNLQNQTLDGAGPKKNVVLGAVLSFEDDPACRRFAEGLRQEAKRREIGLLIEFSEGDAERERQLVQQYVLNSLDAVILCPVPSGEQAALFRSIKQENIPLVALWEPTDILSLDLVDTFVGPDDGQMGQELAAWTLVNWPEDKPILVVRNGPDDLFADSCIARLESFGGKNKVFNTVLDSTLALPEELAEGQREVLVLCRDSDAEKVLASDVDTAVWLAVCGEMETVRPLLQTDGVLGGIYYSAEQDAAAAIEGALLAAEGVKGEFRVRSPLHWTQVEAEV